MQKRPSTLYRPDIDGLRAIAVLAVVFYHLDLAVVPGGYSGVDIFFVISGYLITKILLEEINDSQFSLLAFYERRVRRLMPALFVIMSSATAAGIIVLDPSNLKDFGQSLVAATIFSANILFWHESEYFAPGSLEKPLLHLWSLSLEEQFYFVFPLALALIYRSNKKSLGRWLIVAALLSFASCIFLTKAQPQSAFYLLPARAWELLVGALLAQNAVPAVKTRLQKNIISLAGAVLICSGFILLSKSAVFPGPGALLPVLGTAAIIWSGTGDLPQPFLNRILASRALVLIGLISYSIYLWHWPLIVFAHILLPQGLETSDLLGFFTILFALSSATWKYIEKPFRKQKSIPFSLHRNTGNERGTLRFGLSISALMLGTAMTGVVLHIREGLPQRNKHIRELPRLAEDPQWTEFKKDQETLRKVRDGQLPRVIGKISEKPTFILWGDSHANSLINAIEEQAKTANRAGYVASQEFGAKPLAGIGGFFRKREDSDAVSQNESILRLIEENSDISLVIIAGFWSLEGKYFDATGEALHETCQIKLTELGLNRTAERLHRAGKSVLLVPDVPTLSEGIRAKLWAAQIFDQDVENAAKSLGSPLTEYRRRNEPYTQIFERMRSRFSWTIAPIEAAFYPSLDRSSLIFHNGNLLYVDSNHLSVHGAKYLSEKITFLTTKNNLKMHLPTSN